MKKSKADGKQKAVDVIEEICRGIEATFNPLRLLQTAGGDSTPNCFDLSWPMERLKRVFDPNYENYYVRYRVQSDEGEAADMRTI